MSVVLRVCFGLGITLLLTLMGAVPLIADQPDFAYKLDVQPPQNVGDPFVIKVTATQLSANATEHSTIRVIRPDGQVEYQGLPSGGGASLAGWEDIQTFEETPTQKGQYTIQVIRVFGDISIIPPPEAIQVVAETQVSTDKAQPGLEKLSGQNEGVSVSDLETSPDPPLAGQPAQVLVTLSNASPYTTDAVASLSVTWADGSANKPVGQVLFKALQPGEQRTVPFTWTPPQAVDGAELDASATGSVYTKNWTDGSQHVTPEISAAASRGNQ
jgi:hypothetical protein